MHAVVESPAFTFFVLCVPFFRLCKQITALKANISSFYVWHSCVQSYGDAFAKKRRRIIEIGQRFTRCIFFCQCCSICFFPLFLFAFSCICDYGMCMSEVRAPSAHISISLSTNKTQASHIEFANKLCVQKIRTKKVRAWMEWILWKTSKNYS